MGRARPDVARPRPLARSVAAVEGGVKAWARALYRPGRNCTGPLYEIERWDACRNATSHHGQSGPQTAIGYTYVFENAVAAVFREAADTIRSRGLPDEADAILALCSTLRIRMMETRATLGCLRSSR